MGLKCSHNGEEEEGSVSTEAEIGVMAAASQWSWQTPETGRSKGWILPEGLQRECGLGGTSVMLALDSGLQNCKRTKFCCFKLINFWLFVTAVKGKLIQILLPESGELL